jgi:hypothetical protein
MSPKRRIKAPAVSPVSLGGVTHEPSLPLPWVKYPNHYGTFFVFSESQDGPWHFCKCAETPLTNLIQLNLRFPPRKNSNINRTSPLDSWHVPSDIAAISRKNQHDPISALSFKPKLCHRCNLTQPTWRYCHAMYGGIFDQTFGWYVNQSRLRYGVKRLAYLPEICPNEIRVLVDAAAKALKDWESSPTKQLHRESIKAQQKLKNQFINVTREEFGVCKIGEGWISENMVFNIARLLFPDREIIRHHRPAWLNGLELDLYLPTLTLGIEYQGQQHFHPVDVWGGGVALKAVQARDKLKMHLCAKHNVLLICINYTDPITKHFIAEKIASVGIDVSKARIRQI